MPFSEGPGVYEGEAFGPQAGELDRRIAQRKLAQRNIYQLFNRRPICVAANGAGAATGATGDTNLMLLGHNIFEYHIKGAGQTIVAPVIGADGLTISLDLTVAEGIEITAGITALSPHAFVVGTDPAFFFKARLKVADASGVNPLLVGFRKAEAYQATYTNYADYAAIGIIGTSATNLIKITTEAAGGGNTDTDTTQTWADGAIKTLEVYVSAAGVVTYKINTGSGAGGAAPTVTAAFSFTAGDVVVPFIYMLHAATSPGANQLISWESGFQSAPAIGAG
jgi:hypothetical protein